MKTIVVIAIVLFYVLNIPEATNSIVVTSRAIMPPQRRVIHGHFQQPQQQPNPGRMMVGRGRNARSDAPLRVLVPIALATSQLITVVGNKAEEGNVNTLNTAGAELTVFVVKVLETRVRPHERKRRTV